MPRESFTTSAVVSRVSADGNIYYDAAAHSDAVLNAVDWIHVMGPMTAVTGTPFFL